MKLLVDGELWSKSPTIVIFLYVFVLVQDKERLNVTDTCRTTEQVVQVMVIYPFSIFFPALLTAE